MSVAIFQVGCIALLAAISPGPDFVMVSRNALSFSRKTAILSALGLGAGILVHVILCLSGMAVLFLNWPQLFTVVKILGALYLIRLGLGAVFSKSADIEITDVKSNSTISSEAAFRMGFLSNVLNPKATLFIFSLYTQVLDPAVPILTQGVFGLEVALITFCWFALLTLLLTHPFVRDSLKGMLRYIDRVLGSVLLGWGAYLLL